MARLCIKFPTGQHSHWYIFYPVPNRCEKRQTWICCDQQGHSISLSRHSKVIYSFKLQYMQWKSVMHIWFHIYFREICSQVSLTFSVCLVNHCFYRAHQVGPFCNISHVLVCLHGIPENCDLFFSSVLLYFWQYYFALTHWFSFPVIHLEIG